MGFYTGSVMFTSLCSLALAVFVYIKGRDREQNILLMLFSLALAVWTFGQGMGEIVQVKEQVLFWTRVNIGAAILLPAFYINFIFALLNKKGRGQPGAYLLASIFLVLIFTPLFVRDVAPFHGLRYYPQPGIVYPFFAAYVIFFFLYGFIELTRALFRCKEAEKKKLSYVLIASAIGFLGGATAFFPVFGIGLPVISQFAFPVYMAITAYAIIKHNLLDIDIVIRESLTYSALTLSFAGFYALAILLSSRIFRGVAHLNETWAAIAIVFISVIVFQPLKDWIQSLVDKLFFKGKYYYEKRISDLSYENQRLFMKLLQADKLASLGTLAAGMAHEIRNPLASIKGMTQILPENMSDPKFISDYVDLVPRQLDRINKIVENLMKAGKASKAEKKSVNIGVLLNEVLDFNLNTCNKQGIEVKRDLVLLPQIEADPELLHQVFLNIVLNAIQAMPSGGVLEVLGSCADGKALIEIKDTGEGIPRDKIQNIFDPFFSMKEQGTGLGLFIAYRIIQEHGGTIEVESEKGKGTSFKIWLYTKPKV